MVKTEILIHKSRSGCIDSQTGYNRVYSTVNYCPTSDGGVQVVVHIYCEGCGNNTCSTSQVVKIKDPIDMQSLSSSIKTTIDEMIVEAESDIVENGHDKGTLSRKILTTGEEIKIYQLYMRWYNGRSNGDVEMQITILDITDEINDLR